MTQQNLLSFLNKVRKDIIALGANLAPLTRVVFRNRVSPIGLCLWSGKRKKVCIIEFSTKLLELDEESIHETVAHELLHTIKSSVGHDEKFMKYAKKLNAMYHLNISGYMSQHLVEDGIKHKIYNYVVSCSDCGVRIGYMRKIELIRALAEKGESPDFYCPYCGGSHLFLDYEAGKLHDLKS